MSDIKFNGNELKDSNDSDDGFDFFTFAASFTASPKIGLENQVDSGDEEEGEFDDLIFKMHIMACIKKVMK